MLANTIPVAPFNSILALCGGTRNCIPQPGTATRIDHLGYRQRPLFRLAYRNFGSHESLVTNQSVSAGGAPEISGIRWWEVRSPNAAPVIFQQGTYAPGLTDGIHRWMGSMAMDGEGNIALGYSASSAAVFPSVLYTGRLASARAPCRSVKGLLLPEPARRPPAGTAGATTLRSRSTRRMISHFGTSTNGFRSRDGAGWQLRIGSFKIATGGGGDIVLTKRSRERRRETNIKRDCDGARLMAAV